MKKRLTAFMLVLSLSVAALLAGGTIAYFTAEDTARNVITAGNAQVKVHTELPEEGVEIMPGDTVADTVTVENTGGHPVYLRVKVTARVNDEALSAEECLELDVNEAAWTYKDGYYYLNAALETGATTPALFTKVHFKGDKIDNQYLGRLFTLDVSAGAVQAENNGETVWDAVGFPEA